MIYLIFKIIFIEVSNSHNIKLTSLKYAFQGFLNTFTMLCNHHDFLPHLVFIPAQRLSTPIYSLPPALLCPHPLATIPRLSVFVDLPTLDISCEWNRAVCGLLCLASFTEHIFQDSYML